MKRIVFNEFEKISVDDFNDASKINFQGLTERFFYEVLDKSSGFIRDGFLVTRSSPTSVTVSSGVGFYYDSTQSGYETKYRPMYLAENLSLSLGTDSWASAPAAPNSRIDIIVARPKIEVTKSEYRQIKSGGTGPIITQLVDKVSEFRCEIDVIEGESSLAPIAPETPNGWVKIAEVLISGTSMIASAASVSDLRTKLYSQENPQLLANHAATNSGLHGVSGDIVGTTDSQTISGKDFAQNLIADSDGSRNLGSSTLRWKDIHSSGFLEMSETEVPDIPGSGKHRIYFKDDNKVYYIGSTGSERLLGMDAVEFAGTIPPGVIMPYASELSVPDGYLLCDGSAIPRSSFSRLFQAIGCTHGYGDGVTTFNLPDCRGMFLRGAAFTSVNDPDRSSRTAVFSSTFTITNCVTVSGSPIVAVADTSFIAPGMAVSGTGIPAGSFVFEIINATTFRLGSSSRLAVNATASGSVTLTFARSASSAFVGSIQGHSFQTHTHIQNAHAHVQKIVPSSGGNLEGSILGTVNGGTAVDTEISTASTTAVNQNASASGSLAQASSLETRPINVAVMYIIKY